jgi:hypothetical protein
MGSGLPRHVHAGTHDWGQVLTFQGKSCPLRGLTACLSARKVLVFSLCQEEMRYTTRESSDHSLADHMTGGSLE